MGTLRKPDINFPVSFLTAVIVTGILLLFFTGLAKIKIPTKNSVHPQPEYIPYTKTPETVDLIEAEEFNQTPLEQTRRETAPDRRAKPENILPVPPRMISAPGEEGIYKFQPWTNAIVPHVPNYFTPEQVEQKPRVLRPVTPIYPYQATVSGIEGRIVLRFIVDENGEVQNPEVIKAEPEGVFEEAALAAIIKYKFIPATIGKKKVRCMAVMPVGFKLN